MKGIIYAYGRRTVGLVRKDRISALGINPTQCDDEEHTNDAFLIVALVEGMTVVISPVIHGLDNARTNLTKASKAWLGSGSTWFSPDT